MSRKAFWRCTPSPATRSGWPSPGCCSTSSSGHFRDGRGGFYDTADDAERLVRRPQDPADNATPSGQAAAAGALLTYAALTGSDLHRAAAEEALGVYAAIGPLHPRFAGWGLAVAEALVDGPREVAVVGSASDPRTLVLRTVALAANAPGAVLAVGDPAEPRSSRCCVTARWSATRLPPYVCRHFVCEAPVTTGAALAQLLGSRDALAPSEGVTDRG